MTVLIALKTKDSVWVGADGRISNAGETRTDSFIKWRMSGGGIWWASAGSSRLYTLAAINPPDATKCLGVCEQLRLLVEGDDWNDDGEKDGAPKLYNFYLLVTDGVEIIQYDGDGSFLRYIQPGDFAVQGSGREYSLGAMWALEDSDYSPSVIVRTAINAARKYDQGVGGDADVFEVKPS